MVHVLVVNGNANDLGPRKGIAVLFAAFPEKDEQIGHGFHIGRQVEVFLGLADPFANPGEIDQFHNQLTSRP